LVDQYLHFARELADDPVVMDRGRVIVAGPEGSWTRPKCVGI
jgi:hypothetical protein